MLLISVLKHYFLFMSGVPIAFGMFPTNAVLVLAFWISQRNFSCFLSHTRVPGALSCEVFVFNSASEVKFLTTAKLWGISKWKIFSESFSTAASKPLCLTLQFLSLFTLFKFLCLCVLFLSFHIFLSVAILACHNTANSAIFARCTDFNQFICVRCFVS